ncbi:MAG: hypothetical protein IPJ97_13020 [Proteobacteria bacterium]|nr:hypothetical protein [Pseudomonadota bacterium]
MSLVAEEQRAGTEFAHFLYDLGARADVHPLEHLVWTKSCFAWGEIYPRGMQIDAATTCALQKAFIDYQWQLPLEGMVHILGTPLPDEIVNFDDTARRLNAAHRAHSDELRTFQKAVVNELAGVLDLYQERLADICIEMHQRQEGRRPELSATERRGTESQMRTAFINLFRLRPEVMAKWRVRERLTRPVWGLSSWVNLLIWRICHFTWARTKPPSGFSFLYRIYTPSSQTHCKGLNRAVSAGNGRVLRTIWFVLSNSDHRTSDIGHRTRSLSRMVVTAGRLIR